MKAGPSLHLPASHSSATGSQKSLILVVDDYDGVRRYIAAVLRRLGYPVIEAANLAEASEASQRCTGPIDLLVTNVVLPDATGEDVAQQLMATWPELAVLYISDHPRDGLRERALPAGIRFLPKPFTRDALVLHVQEAIRKQMPNRILFVDDDPIVTRLAARALNQAGFEVLEAANGRQAMAILMEQDVDLVITDIVMPEMEGLEMIGALRKSRPSLPVVAISGAFDGRYLDMALVLGARATLAKPLSLPRLLQTVRQTLGLDPAGAEPADR